MGGQDTPYQSGLAVQTDFWRDSAGDIVKQSNGLKASQYEQIVIICDGREVQEKRNSIHHGIS